MMQERMNAHRVHIDSLFIHVTHLYPYFKIIELLILRVDLKSLTLPFLKIHDEIILTTFSREEEPV